MFKQIWCTLFFFMITELKCQQFNYYCDLDDAADPCSKITSLRMRPYRLTEGPGILPPDTDFTFPQSDVTSILSPDDQNQTCALPYRNPNYQWPVNFCISGTCTAQNNVNMKCNKGKFLYTETDINRDDILQMNAKTSLIGGTGDQCFIFYYYMRQYNDKLTTIDIQISETNGKNSTINSIKDAPCNSWIRSQTNFQTSRNYQVFFVIKTTGSYEDGRFVGLDEISILQGPCNDTMPSIDCAKIIPIIKPPTTTTTTSTTSSTTTTTATTSTAATTTTSTTATTTTSTTATTTSSITATITTPTLTTSTTTYSTSTSSLSNGTPSLSSSMTDASEAIPQSTSTTSTDVLQSSDRLPSSTPIFSTTPIQTTTISNKPTLSNDETSNKQTMTIILATVIPGGIILVAVVGLLVKKLFFTRDDTSHGNLYDDTDNGDSHLIPLDGLHKKTIF